MRDEGLGEWLQDLLFVGGLPDLLQKSQSLYTGGFASFAFVEVEVL